MPLIPTARGIPDPGYEVPAGDTTAHLRMVTLGTPDGQPVVMPASGQAKAGGVRFRSDWTAAPDGGPDGIENPGTELPAGAGASVVRVGVILSPVLGARCGLYVITEFDPDTTYSVTIDAATYSTTAPTSAQEAAEELADAITQAAVDREDPRAEAVQVSYDGATCWAVLVTVWGADLDTPPAVAFDGSTPVSGGTGTAVMLAQPASVTYALCVRPRSSEWAVGRQAWAYAEGVDAVVATANATQDYDLSDYDRVTVQVLDVTPDQGDTGCSPLIGIDIAPSVA